MNNLLHQRYIIRNAASQRKSRKYAQKILRFAKNVNMIDVWNQLNIIYNDIDVEVRFEIFRRSKNENIINDMLNDLDEFKHDWWAKTTRMRNNNIDTQNNRNQLLKQNVRSQNQFDQYVNNRQSQHQRQTFQNQFRYQNNVYQNYQSSQSRQKYQQSNYQQNDYKQTDYSSSYQIDNYLNNNNNQNDQYSNVRALSSSNRLQITVESTNDDASNSNQQSQQRQSFRSLSNNQSRDDYDDYFSRFQTIYQINVFEKIDENVTIWILNDANDAHWLANDQKKQQSEYFHDDYNYDLNAVKNVNFLSSIAEVADVYICQRCFVSFFFRNQLFKHLRHTCWIEVDFNHVVSMTSATRSASNQAENRRLIQFVVVSNQINLDYVFREYQYDKMSMRLKNNQTIINICVDIDNLIIMKERDFFTQLLSNVSVQKLVFFVSVRDVNDKIIKFDEYMKIKMFFDDVLNSKNSVSKQSIIDVIDAKIHFIDDFAVNLLLSNDVIYFQNMKIDSKKRRLIIEKCENIRVSFEMHNRSKSHVKRIIRFRQTYTLMSNDLTKISVIYHDLLSNDKDFLFESQCSYDLKYEKKVYAHVVDNNLSKMFVRNVTSESITLVKRIRLNTVIEYNQIECYLIMSKKSHKTASGWMIDRSWKKQLVVSFVIIAATYVVMIFFQVNEKTFVFVKSQQSTIVVVSKITYAMSVVSQIDLKLKHVFFNDVTIYDENVFDFVNLIDNFQNIFQNFDFIVNISKKKWMSINLKSSAISKANKIYSLKTKNRNFIDATFDKLHEQNKLHWITQFIEFNYSVFVIWRDTSIDQKNRVVIDIKKLNDIIENDSYSLSLQTNIIAKIADFSFISIINVVN